MSFRSESKKPKGGDSAHRHGRCLAVAIIAALLLSAVAPAPAPAADIVYPAGAGVTVGHTMSAASLIGGDTLVISRTLANRGDLPLSGLYFSGTIPASFYVVRSEARINGRPVSFAFSESYIESVSAGSRTYHWVIDDPTGFEPVRNAIAPGDSLELTIRTVCGQPGEYLIPDRATVFFAGGGGYFAVNDGAAPMVTVLPCCEIRGNVDGNDESGGPIDVADLTYLVAYIFRLGPPPPCEEQANVDGSTEEASRVNIADVSTLAAYLFRNTAPPPPCGQ